MKSVLLVVVAMAICFCAYASGESRAGVWVVEVQGDTLQMTLFRTTLGDPPGNRNLLGFAGTRGRTTSNSN